MPSSALAPMSEVLRDFDRYLPKEQLGKLSDAVGEAGHIRVGAFESNGMIDRCPIDLQKHGPLHIEGLGGHRKDGQVGLFP